MLLSGILYAQEVEPATFPPIVPLASFSPDIIQDVKYATKDNFTGKAIYSHGRVFLREPVALALVRVQERLRRDQGLGLKIFDGYRPLSVQRKFWQILPDPRFVADPRKGSRHNRGGSVDVTLVASDARDLDMGTGYDDFTEKAAHGFRILPAQVLENRRLLRSFMEKEGFVALESEWWHYDFEGAASFPIEDFPTE